jgi:hypothetical protein
VRHFALASLIALVAVIAVPSSATADNSISYVGATLTVDADGGGTLLEYRAFRTFRCVGFPTCTPPPPDYDIASPQAFSSLPAGCTDNSSGVNTDYDCNPVPSTTVVNGSAVADTVEASCFLSTSRLVFSGSGGDDNVASTCANSSLSLGAGSDSATLSGAATASGADGDDTIIAGTGPNELTGDGGKDTLSGGSGIDTLDGGDGNDAIDGGAGDDTLRGGPRRDMLTGGAGTDTLEGGDGIDLVSFEDKSGSQPVNISLNAAADDGEPGEGDTIAADVENAVGSDGPDTIVGNGDANDLDAGNGGDVINPGGGPDFVDAGAGDDRVGARDGAQDRIECGDGNDVAVTDEFDTATNCETVRASRELMSDVDNDGIPAPADCNDGNPAMRPGLPDRPGNGVDENCENGDAAFARVITPVQSLFSVKRSRTKVLRLRVVDVPAGAVIELRCSGGKRRGCFKGVKRFQLPTGAAAKNVRKPVRRRRLKAKSMLEVRVLAPDSIGKVVRYRMRSRGRLPVSTLLCLTPGAQRPAKC